MTDGASGSAGDAGAAGASDDGAAAGNAGGSGGAAQASANGAGDAGLPADWTQPLSAEYKNYVQQKGFKDPGAVLESYVNLEKLVGVPKEQLLKLPQKADDPAWNDVYSKLGKPEKSDGYNLVVPKENGDENFANWAKETFHGLNLSKAQGENLVEKWNAYIAGVREAQAKEYEAAVLKDVEKLKTDWGMAHDQNLRIAQRAAEVLGFDEAKIDQFEQVMGFQGVMRLLHDLGTKLGEDKFVSGEGLAGGKGFLTPDTAQQRIQALKGDPEFAKRYVAGEVAARDEMERLHKMAYPPVAL
jgi:hypothetical protein